MTEKVSDRELEAILKLVELTQAGAMRWRSVQPWGDLTADDDVKYSSVFTPEFESKKIRIILEKRRVDTRTAGFFLSIGESGGWRERAILQITNIDGASLWTFPTKPASADLLKAAQRYASGATDLIDKLLGTTD